jgi:5-methylcytosine-specific restriction protein B
VENQNNRKTVGAALADDDVETTHFCLYAPGNEESKWDEFYEEGIMGIGWGKWAISKLMIPRKKCGKK